MLPSEVLEGASQSLGMELLSLETALSRLEAGVQPAQDREKRQVQEVVSTVGRAVEALNEVRSLLSRGAPCLCRRLNGPSVDTLPGP